MDLLFGPEPIAAVQRLFGPGCVPFFELVSLLGSNWGVVLGLGIAVWLGGRRATLLAPAVFAGTGLGAREGEPGRPASAGGGGSAPGPGGSRG